MAGLARDAGALGVVVDATAVHDLGASDAQELGYSLAVGAAYLRALTDAGWSVDDALATIEFRYAATDEQFPTIAKLRAARRLWSRVAELSDATPEAAGQRQHAVTSRPMMSKYDPWVNMLRTTVAAFAAGVGGADAVTVLPFDAALGAPDAFARRIARNTSSLLISESHVAKVADPAGGSYAVEKLTDDLARAAWAELGRIEEAGGILAALDDGSLRARIDEVVAVRDDQVAHRTRPLTGVSEFPHLGETLPERTPAARRPTGVRRYGAAFEALRDEPAARPVFLATMGTVAAHTARATFATNLFAAGGVAVEVAGPTDGVDAVLAAYDGQPVVCLAGTDPAYAEWGAAAGRRPPRRRGHARDPGRQAEGHRGRRLLCRRRGRPDVPEPHEGGPRMSVPKSFAGLPLDGSETPPIGQKLQADVADGRRLGPNGNAWQQPRKASRSSRSTAPSTSPTSTRSTPGPGSARSCAARTPRCTPPSRGRSASTPGSRPPRSPTRSTGATWRPGRRA